METCYLFGDEGYIMLRGISHGNGRCMPQIGGDLGRDIVLVIFHFLLVIEDQEQAIIGLLVEYSQTIMAHKVLIMV
jgi:hypothetical protein